MDNRLPTTLAGATLTAIIVSVSVTWFLVDLLAAVQTEEVARQDRAIATLRQRVSRLEWRCGRLQGMLGMDEMDETEENDGGINDSGG